MLRRLIRENIALTVELGPGPLPVVADRSKLDQVLLNLVINASDAMPAGGPITIRTGATESQEVWVEVEDRGSGISDGVLDRIFEPFFTTKDPDRGTGLGLAVAHTIVEERGGRFEVTTRVGRGSTFRAVLPRSEGPIAAPERAATFSPSALGRGERVLVVEDEPGAREGLVELLDLLGFAVTACASGEEALALPPEPPAVLLLTDLLLPGIHGGDLAERLRARWPGLTVIVMSGYSQDESVHQGVREGKVHFLQKPFSIAELSREISLALSRRGE
ncbi:MAG: ATP-binding protein [Thermoanaerobaculaceae bacterium]